MILFIDDEKRYVDNICEELRFRGKEVSFSDGVDDALKQLDDLKGLEVIVCDVMMPHGRSFSAADTDDNRRTGLRFLRQIRDRGITAPVVLLTNDDRQHVKDEASEFPPCLVIEKKLYPSFEIAEQIVGSLNNG